MISKTYHFVRRLQTWTQLACAPFFQIFLKQNKFKNFYGKLEKFNYKKNNQNIKIVKASMAEEC